MYKIELNERELYLVLLALDAKMDRIVGSKLHDSNHAEHKALHDRLEMIFEGR